jgi:hypothetical protein
MFRGMMNFYLFGAVIIALISTSAGAAMVGPELISDPYFDDPSSWNVGIGSSVVENGHLVIINHSGFIFPEPRLETEVGKIYQYALTVDLVNNLSGNGKVTVGGQTIWEPSVGRQTACNLINVGIIVLNHEQSYKIRIIVCFIICDDLH